ncbi:hypothetical protein [Micromonospora peucetia]|uniref:Uncharacterized protein n=1 Tax=Micromonospora peucetia TaxID=47871 RepID=A0A1C6UZZ5_9ACTN|nr:hypothetical protein [Micromonospora peucetia]WSA35129.1 hypothetical protein OIE14_14325 [Micromonospora peucetia]SCL59592.1 hypothetical protein GA0070608_2173 [Micromonospora peucetia]
MELWPPAADDALLAELRAALRDPGPVPEEFLAAALAAFSWRTVDAELAVAALTFDSACDLEPAGLTRSTGSARTLTFRTGPVVVEIEVTPAGIVGQLAPARGGRVTARTPAGRYEEVPVDAVGFFSMGSPPAGPVQLCARTAEYAVATAWVSLR